MWTGLPCENFHLLICCSILDSEKHKIMEENMGFNEILKVRRSLLPAAPPPAVRGRSFNSDLICLFSYDLFSTSTSCR